MPLTPTLTSRVSGAVDSQRVAEPAKARDLTKCYGIVYVTMDFVMRSARYPAMMAGARVLKADIDPATNTVSFTMLHPQFEELGFMKTAPTYVAQFDTSDDEITVRFRKMGGDVDMRNFRMEADDQERTYEAPVDRGPDYRVKHLTR